MQKIETMPIRETVFLNLRKMILDGTFQPGEKLNEKVVASELGVSRTPIREAMYKLEQEGLVKIVPRKYTEVIGITDESISEIHRIRAALEPIAAYEAVNNLTQEEINELERLWFLSKEYFQSNDINNLMKTNDQFHSIISEASRLPKVVNILRNMHDYVEVFRYSFMSRPELAERSINEHKKILDAIRVRSSNLVKKLVIEHLEGIFEYEKVILEDMKRKPISEEEKK